ncbi:hypothetical protein [Streptomyces griseorubiginosus]|uniref:hypothetical protein n=1 Tax=Streptomyces griseorubiginosus TaxID=67304 RepID=UPI002E81C7B3|nr:hypothetical protein [Streptomyces griseorubiginosus]WUB46905.1 hypothetical protein OHN19_27665 [Streptomyces griseorubiginosus]WUB55427.1 hypothetical protein OG942_27670 [Streptomyces griseorubiginosus]
MSQLLPLLTVLAGLTVTLAVLTLLARHVRRRGTAGAGLRGALAAHDEVWHGTAADSYCELQVQTDRRAPLPDDRWRRRVGR